MMFWILAALLTAGMLILLLRPLLLERRARGIQPAEVYKAQLSEVEREAEAGLISNDDAASARTEIARRILRAEEAGADESDAVHADYRGVALGLAAGFVVLALGMYVWLGQPDMPGQPFAARDIEVEQADRSAPAVQELEQRLSELEDPADRALLIGDVFAELGAADDAERSYLNALGHRPGDPDILIRLAEVQIMRSQGMLNAGGLARIDEALAVSPDHPAANFYRALYDFQQGNYQEAEDRLTDLLEGAPEDAGWTDQVEGLLTDVQAGAAQTDSLAQMSDEERETMIRGMVDQLAARLEESPGDFEGWLRLANAYAVLGEQEAAQNALSRARALATGEPVLERRVESVADSLSLE